MPFYMAQLEFTVGWSHTEDGSIRGVPVKDGRWRYRLL